MHDAFLRAAPRSSGCAQELYLQVLDGFQLAYPDGPAIPLPSTGERVLAFLALHEHPVRRCMVAGSLWPDTSETRSSGSLRSALWRVGSMAGPAVDAQGALLCLAPTVKVDLHELVGAAHDLRDGRPPPGSASLITRFEEELLPDWYDDWIVLHRERWRQIRLHALESLAELLRRAGDCSTAAEAGLAAVRADPLRETAHGVLIETFLTEGNRPEALRQYRTYETILHDELGLTPSDRLAAMVGVAPDV